jgi:ferritin
LTQWNILPQIPPVTVPNNFDSLVGIIDEAYDIEYKLLLSYSAFQHAISGVHPPTFNFIQKYVDIQNDSVAEYSDLLNALHLIDINNKLDLLVFEERYF